ncbi:MAG: hypothetical protein DRN68_03160 [Thaumarchaeota archaeon]|nr:MAG: hypothetical protein DRN68_03160 [Nitrososphaerota archaeon]
MSLRTGLEKILEDLSEALRGDLVGCAFARSDGLMITSMLPSGMDKQIVAALSATINNVAKRLCEDLNRGEPLKTLIEGSKGKIISMPIEKDIILITLTSEKPNLGLIFIEMERAAEDTKALLSKPKRP